VYPNVIAEFQSDAGNGGKHQRNNKNNNEKGTKANNNNNVGNQNQANPGATLSYYPKAQTPSEVFTSLAKCHMKCNTVSSSLVSNIVKIAMVRFLQYVGTVSKMTN
jgi:hypothetical protein